MLLWLGACAGPEDRERAIVEGISNLIVQVLEKRPDLIVQGLEKSPAELAKLKAQVAPTTEQVRALLEGSPGIVFGIMEKHPDRMAKLFPAVERASDPVKRGGVTERGQTKRASAAGPEIDPGRAMLGPARAAVTIVAYSDFQYPPCAKAARTMREVLAKYRGKVRLLLKHNPHESHLGAVPAAEYFEALALQGAQLAYRFLDRIFADQQELDDLGDFAHRVARRLAFDPKKLEVDRHSEVVRTRILKDQEEAHELGLIRTPSFVIEGEKIEGAASLSTLVEIIERKLSGKG